VNRRDFVSMLGSVMAVGRLGGTAVKPLNGTFRLPAIPPSRLVERWSWAMGQPVHLMLFHESEAGGLEAASKALAELRRVEARLSRFDDASDLSELNRHAAKAPMKVDHDLLEVLTAAARSRRTTNGAFDIAVEPLMRVWGFREARKAPPGTVELREAEKAVRASVVQIDGDQVTLPSAVTQLDLGGIGVGYGLDRAAGVLRSCGVERAFLDVSGDCIALRAPPGQEGWRVELADPNGSGPSRPAGFLRDRALATSANTMSVVRYGAMIQGHVMDPATGYPADSMAQVTVRARTGIEADVLSTAMLVSGQAFEGVEKWWGDRPTAGTGSGEQGTGRAAPR
jgi:FAD:protein FMN transferase